MAKLADMMAAARESNFTEEQFNNLRAEKNAKRVFDILRNGFSFQEKEYSAACWQILDYVAKNITGFQADIAEKAKWNKFSMSEKQTWCVAFSFIK